MFCTSINDIAYAHERFTVLTSNVIRPVGCTAMPNQAEIRGLRRPPTYQISNVKLYSK